MAEKEQKKRGGCLKWIVIIFGLLILLGACGVMLGGGEDSTDTTTDEAAADNNSKTDETAEETEIKTESGKQEETASEDEEVIEDDQAEEVVGIGETLTVDNIDFTVNELYQQDVVGDIITSNANDTYLILDVSVTNNQNEAVMLSSSYFKIVDGETVYEPDTGASMTANQAISPDNLGLLAEEINPGSSRNALIVYDLTQSVIDSSTKELQVQSGMFGTETGIITLQQ